MSKSLEEKLHSSDMSLVKDTFTQYLADEGIDPRGLNVTKALIDALLGRMEQINPRWIELPDIDQLWTCTAIKHMRDHIRNQFRDNCVPLLRAVEKLKSSMTAS